MNLVIERKMLGSVIERNSPEEKLNPNHQTLKRKKKDEDENEEKGKGQEIWLPRVGIL